MKIISEQKLNSSTEEILDIHIQWDPSKDEEDGLAALLATIVDLVKKYQRLNTLVGDE